MADILNIDQKQARKIIKSSRVAHKIKGKWYIPRCGIIRIPNIKASTEEIYDYYKLSAKIRINNKSDVVKKYLIHEAERRLKNLDEEHKESIVNYQMNRINELENRLIYLAETMDQEELKFIFESKLNLKKYKDREEEIKDLYTILKPEVNTAVTKKWSKYYGYKQPFLKIYYNFKSHYRAGVGWQKIRKDIIKSRGGCCEECGSIQNLEVHHKKNTQNNNEKDLEVLCRECHRTIRHNFKK